MFKFCLILFCFGLVFGEGGNDLPSWITESQGFKQPTEEDSIKTGNGSISSVKKGSEGWVVYLNDKDGHGIEVEVSELNLNPDSDDFLLISPWPLTTNFKQIKLYTGEFKKPLKKLRIPNTKTFFVLFSSSSTTNSPKMSLSYMRYGLSIELNPLPTENPIKKKETVHEIQLKGKELEQYASPEFLSKLKEGIRATAHRYATAHNIPFNEDIPTEKMVLLHKITSCPFEWPERNICASLKHSIYISGRPVPEEEIILDYQLTADHLKTMWSEGDFPELQELGVTVFELPPTYSTVFYWSLIIGLIIISSLIGTFVFWKVHHTTVQSVHSTVLEEIPKVKRPKLAPSKNQRIPSFMKDNTIRSRNKEALLESSFEDVKLDSSQPPIQNYLASILFNSNRAFEDDEEKAVEFRRQKPSNLKDLRIRATDSFSATNI